MGIQLVGDEYPLTFWVALDKLLNMRKKISFSTEGLNRWKTTLPIATSLWQSGLEYHDADIQTQPVQPSLAGCVGCIRSKAWIPIFSSTLIT